MCTTPSEQKTTVRSQWSVCRLRSSPLVWSPSLILIQPRTLKFCLHKGTIVGGSVQRSYPLPWRGISQSFFLERWGYIPWLNLMFTAAYISPKPLPIGFPLGLVNGKHWLETGRWKEEINEDISFHFSLPEVTPAGVAYPLRFQCAVERLLPWLQLPTSSIHPESSSSPVAMALKPW